MKKLVATLSITALILFCGQSLFAQIAPNQQITIAFVDVKMLLDTIPESKQARNNLITLSDNYKKELQLMENEYNKKYSDYITYQSTLSENIKLRRMQELTDLEDQIQKFIEVSQQDLKNQEQIMMEQLRAKIGEAVRAVSIERNFTVVYDKSDLGVLFISPTAVDATQPVLARLLRR